MRVSPWFLGAIPAALVAGAITGTALADDPLTRGYNDPLDNLPRHKAALPSAEEARSMKAPHNHYPLKTPNGVIEVHELAYHGRLRNRLREQPLYGAGSEAKAYAIPLDAAYDEPRGKEREYNEASRGAGSFADRESAMIARGGTVRDHDEVADADVPDNFVELEPGIFENNARTPASPSTDEPAGQARRIDVAAELAGRR